MITLAVDIGGTKISAALISDDGSFLLKKQISTPHERCPDEMTG
ncbi:ROK family protein, partial [Escherichia coli]|nr:ROK family protein [Escherichia coli]